MSNLVMNTNEGKTVRLVAGLDIGNGYTKGSIRNLAEAKPTVIDMPSCASVISHPQNFKPTENEIPEIVNNMFDWLDIVVGSNMVSETRRLYIGNRGVNSGVRPIEFNVASHLSKAHNPLTVQMLLACIAGKTVKDLYADNMLFDKTVTTVECVVALALPIREYIQHGNQFREALMKQPHMVTVHNFNEDVVMRVVFKEVQVLAEGVAAQYGITVKGQPFMEAILSYARNAMIQTYGMGCKDSMLFQVTAQDVLSATNTVGIDIGEGTVNFPVFRKGRFDADVSTNLMIGYGSVLSSAIEELQNFGFPYDTRKELTEYLNNQPSIMQKRKYDMVKGIVDNHITNLVESIAVDFSSTMNKAGAVIEVVYVYGGGATPIQNELYKKLMDTMKVNQQDDVLLLYLDSSWSRSLNREGLLAVAEQIISSIPAAQTEEQ